jgi:hypothetical protein
MGHGGWRRRHEYKRGDVHQDDRCRTEIDGETEPPRCRDVVRAGAREKDFVGSKPYFSGMASWSSGTSDTSSP